MRKIFKKDVDFLITQLNTPELAEISQASKYVNFQRGSKASMRRVLKSAKTQTEIRDVWNYAKDLYNYQQLGVSGMVETYLSRHAELGMGFRKAYFYAQQYGLPNHKVLKMFEIYDSTLTALSDSGEIEKLVEEFLFDEYGDLDELDTMTGDYE